MADGDGDIDAPEPKQIAISPTKMECSSSEIRNIYPFGFGGAKSLRLSQMNSFDIPSVPCIFASPRACSPKLSRQLTRHPSWDQSNTDFSSENRSEAGSSSDYRKNEFSGSLRRYGIEHVNCQYWTDSQMEIFPFDQSLLDWAGENKTEQSDSESLGIDTSDLLLDSPNLVQQTTDQIAHNLENPQNENEGVRIDTDVLPNLHCDSRRRCLVYETTGSPPRHLDSNNTDISNVNTKPNLAKPKSGSSSGFIVSGFGLHLNSLVPIPNSAVSQDLNRALVVFGEQEVEAEEGKMSQNNWKKKRRRLGNGEEIEGCRRCNCKKSKCLKLYCECFAAGLFCMGSSCSCQECLNKPMHEDMVIETRKMIVTRNPLAFAPKVTLPENGKVDSSRTPASARHKKGCNCRKSSCLKKYCECYQSGVGCSIGCRCEGCRNPVGRKDGSEEEEETILPNNTMVETIHETILPNNAMVETILPNNVEHNQDSELCPTPLEAVRETEKTQSLSSVIKRPPRLSNNLLVTSNSSYNASKRVGKENMWPPQPMFEKQLEPVPQVLKVQFSPGNGIKTSSSSPNGKRVSSPYNAESTYRSGRIRLSPSSTGKRRKIVLQSIP